LASDEAFVEIERRRRFCQFLHIIKVEVQRGSSSASLLVTSLQYRRLKIPLERRSLDGQALLPSEMSATPGAASGIPWRGASGAASSSSLEVVGAECEQTSSTSPSGDGLGTVDCRRERWKNGFVRNDRAGGDKFSAFSQLVVLVIGAGDAHHAAFAHLTDAYTLHRYLLREYSMPGSQRGGA
jgi:hypothetical protein